MPTQKLKAKKTLPHRGEAEPLMRGTPPRKAEPHSCLLVKWVIREFDGGLSKVAHSY